MTKKGAKAAGFVFLVLSAGLAINYTFVEPEWFMAMFCISLVFPSYFLFRNPKFLLVRNFNEAMDEYDNLRDKKFISGTTPLYPATLLLALLYIAWARQSWPFG